MPNGTSRPLSILFNLPYFINIILHVSLRPSACNVACRWNKHIMALSGWKSPAMAKRYAWVNPVELHDQILTLEKLPS